MINRKKTSLLLLILLSVSLFMIEASAQRKQRPRQSFSPAGMTASQPQRKLDSKAKDVNQSFAEALSVVRENYVDRKKVRYDDVVKSSILTMLHTLDPHSDYFSGKDYAALKIENGFGVGMTIGDRKLGGEPATFVLASSEGSPAANANLRFGDKILEVNGWQAEGHSSTEVGDRLRGPNGSKVKIIIERAADGQRQTVEMTRSTVKRLSVPDAYMLQPGVGYVDLTPGFFLAATDELADQLGKLRNQGMTALVLDLRDNTGGLLYDAVRIADQFLPKGQRILELAGRVSTPERIYESQNQEPDKSSLVLLVNRKTASGPEIIAAALQDQDRALIVGELTFGHGLIRSVFPLPHGAALMLTTYKMLTPSGRLIQRDYSNLGYYEYLARGNGADPINHFESTKGTGGSGYRGAGILPDEVVKPRVPSKLQERMIDPVFGFVRELLNARIVGFETYKVPGALDFTRGIKPDELPVAEDLFKALKQFVAREPGYRLTEKQLDANREFIVRQMRLDLATAAYGPLMAARLSRVEDPQVLKAIETIPRAAALAASKKD